MAQLILRSTLKQVKRGNHGAKKEKGANEHASKLWSCGCMAFPYPILVIKVVNIPFIGVIFNPHGYAHCSLHLH